MADTSVWQLITHASFIVQLVMLVLLAGSVASWTFIFQRYQVLKQAKKDFTVFEGQFWSGSDLSDLYALLHKKQDQLSGISQIFHDGFEEFLRTQQHADMHPDKQLESIQRAMRVAFSREVEKLEQHLSFLATVGSTSPYIGLFGTVWGIMVSIRELGSVSQANIAMVAPGISEALIATAMGLFAAIPAYIAYNRFSNQAERLIAQYGTFQEEFSNILQRQVYTVKRAAVA